MYLRCDVRASCGFEGGALGIQTSYRDVCGAPYTTASSSYVLGVKRADLSLAKIGQNLSRTSPSKVYLYAEPGEVVVFTITVASAASVAPITTSNVVSTVVGAPNVLVAKSVESSAGLTTELDGLAYLTYTV